jgi:flagellar biosynthesis/type III secretory pathway M-ring protein FliF/YscJ
LGDTADNLTPYNNTGDIMDKWKELSKRKKFWVAVGVLVVIALVGWVSGWWASPEVV